MTIDTVGGQAPAHAQHHIREHLAERLEHAREAWKHKPGEGETLSREGTRTLPGGDVVSWSDQVTGTESGFERVSTRTDAQGHTYTRNAVVSRDPETGAMTRHVTMTTPEGQTYATTGTLTRGEDGFVHTSTRLDGEGNVVRQAETSGTRTEDGGVFERTVSRATEDGGAVTRHTLRQREEGYQSLLRERTITDAEGEVLSHRAFRRERSV